jgi:hypothetical protein
MLDDPCGGERWMAFLNSAPAQHLHEKQFNLLTTSQSHRFSLCMLCILLSKTPGRILHTSRWVRKRRRRRRRRILLSVELSIRNPSPTKNPTCPRSLSYSHSTTDKSASRASAPVLYFTRCMHLLLSHSRNSRTTTSEYLHRAIRSVRSGLCMQSYSPQMISGRMRAKRAHRAASTLPV